MLDILELVKLPHYLVRHRKDDDAPYAVSGATAVIAFLIVFFFALAAGQAYLLRGGSLAAVISSSLVSLANGDREAQGLAPLALNPTLVAVAQAKANDMAAKGYFAHTSPEGHDPWYWFGVEGYSYRYAGENLAVDFTDSVTVEEAWMNSPEHRANLLDNHYTEIGIATAQGMFNGHQTTFVAEEFGTPAPAPTEFAEPAPPALNTAQEPQPELVKTAPLKVTATPIHPSVAGVDTTTQAPSTTPAGNGPTTTTVVAPASESGATGQSPVPPSSAPEPSFWASILASPSTVLGWAYYLLAVIVLLLFAYLTELELHKRHLRHALEAGGLLTLMLLLFTLADFLFFAHPVLAAL